MGEYIKFSGASTSYPLLPHLIFLTDNYIPDLESIVENRKAYDKGTQLALRAHMIGLAWNEKGKTDANNRISPNRIIIVNA